MCWSRIPAGRSWTRARRRRRGESPPRTRYLIRVTHSSGMLEGKYTKDTVFPPTDHRSHRPKSWLINGLKKIETLQFLVGPGPHARPGRAAVAAGRSRASPAACRTSTTRRSCENSPPRPESPALTADELARVAELAANNFGIEGETPNYKGTMTREAAAV